MLRVPKQLQCTHGGCQENKKRVTSKEGRGGGRRNEETYAPPSSSSFLVAYLCDPWAILQYTVEHRYTVCSKLRHSLFF